MKRIKIILLVLSILFISGCDLLKREEKIKTINPQDYLYGYYQMKYSCVYQKEELMYCDFDKSDYYMTASKFKIKLIKPYLDNLSNVEVWTYSFDESSIILKSTNSNEKTKFYYTINKNFVDDNIILEETIINNDGVPLIFKSIYERISKEDYIRKTGATYEE